MDLKEKHGNTKGYLINPYRKSRTTRTKETAVVVSISSLLTCIPEPTGIDLFEAAKRKLWKLPQTGNNKHYSSLGTLYSYQVNRQASIRRTIVGGGGDLTSRSSIKVSASVARDLRTFGATSALDSPRKPLNASRVPLRDILLLLVHQTSPACRLLPDARKSLKWTDNQSTHSVSLLQIQMPVKIQGPKRRPNCASSS